MPNRQPQPKGAAPSDDLPAGSWEQQRQAVIMAGMQVDIGDQKVSLAVLQKDISDIIRELGGLKIIIQGADGEQSVIMRLSVLEQNRLHMADQLKEIIDHLDKRSSEARGEQRQLLLAVVSVFVTVIVAAAMAIVSLLHK